MGIIHPASPHVIMPYVTKFTVVDSDSNYNGPAFCDLCEKGDLIVFSSFIVDNGGTIPAYTPPGFTSWLSIGNLVEISNYRSRLQVAYKIADGTEVSVPGRGGMESEITNAVTFRPDHPIQSIFASGTSGQNTQGNPTPITIDSNLAKTPCIAFGFYASAAAVSPRTMSPAKDGEEGSNPDEGSWIAWKFFFEGTAPVSISIDQDDEGNLNTIIGGYLEFR